jgi:hypothetical protein
MFKRNIDFIAVGLIAVVMLGFSWASSLRIDSAVSPIEIQNVVNGDPCPLTQALSRIEYIVDESTR